MVKSYENISELWNLMYSNIKNNLSIYIEITMSNMVTQPFYATPRNIRFHLVEITRKNAVYLLHTFPNAFD